MTQFHTPRADEFVRILRGRVSDRTFKHSVSTAAFMASIAEEAGITEEQAVTAGLLHDLCKGVENTRMVEIATQYGIQPSATQIRKPGLLHGPIAAEECRRTLGITDEAVYEAIYWHTTGHAGWGNVGLALFLADYIEPLRVFADAARARTILTEQGFCEALYFAALQKWKYVHARPDADPATEAFHEWLETTKPA